MKKAIIDATNAPMIDADVSADVPSESSVPVLRVAEKLSQVAPVRGHAKVMLANPSIVIIDEPTRGIDIGNKSQIYHFIDELVRAGKACVVISSELPELVGVSDRVLVMRGGRFVAELTGDDITEQNVVYAAASSRHDTEGRNRA